MTPPSRSHAARSIPHKFLISRTRPGWARQGTCLWSNASSDIKIQCNIMLKNWHTKILSKFWVKAGSVLAMFPHPQAPRRSCRALFYASLTSKQRCQQVVYWPLWSTSLSRKAYLVCFMENSAGIVSTSGLCWPTCNEVCHPHLMWKYKLESQKFTLCFKTEILLFPAIANVQTHTYCNVALR